MIAFNSLFMDASKAGMQKLKAVMGVGPLTAQQKLNKKDPKVIILEERKGKAGKYEPVMKAYPVVACDRKDEGMVELMAEVDMTELIQPSRFLIITKLNNRYLLSANDIFVFFDLLGDSILPEVYSKEKVEKMKN